MLCCMHLKRTMRGGPGIGTHQEVRHVGRPYGYELDAHASVAVARLVQSG